MDWLDGIPTEWIVIGAAGVALILAGLGLVLIAYTFNRDAYRGTRRMGEPQEGGPYASLRAAPRIQWHKTPSGSWRVVESGQEPTHHRAEGTPLEDTRRLHPGYSATARARVHLSPQLHSGLVHGRMEP